METWSESPGALPRVKYRYSTTPASPSAGSVLKLRPEDLAALPAELRDAVIALDHERIQKAIQRVSASHPALAEILAGFADRFAYTAMFNALEADQERSAAKGA